MVHTHRRLGVSISVSRHPISTSAAQPSGDAALRFLAREKKLDAHSRPGARAFFAQPDQSLI
jgi:hypothetical protein